jgi:hypothetical protein
MRVLLAAEALARMAQLRHSQPRGGYGASALEPLGEVVGVVFELARLLPSHVSIDLGRFTSHVQKTKLI